MPAHSGRPPGGRRVPRRDSRCGRARLRARGHSRGGCRSCTAPSPLRSSPARPRPGCRPWYMETHLWWLVNGTRLLALLLGHCCGLPPLAAETCPHYQVLPRMPVIVAPRTPRSTSLGKELLTICRRVLDPKHSRSDVNDATQTESCQQAHDTDSGLMTPAYALNFRTRFGSVPRKRTHVAMRFCSTMLGRL